MEEPTAVFAERLGGRGHDRGGVVGLHRGQDAELIPAQAVGAAAVVGHGLLQGPGQPDQQGVAGGVAEGVVVALEAVEVEQHQQQRLGRAGLLQPILQVELELAPVGDAGQGVGHRGGDEQPVLGQERDGGKDQQCQRHDDERDRPAADPVQGADRGAGGGDDVPVVGVVSLPLEALEGQRTVTHRA
jgi:hypothetical protein